MDHRQRTLIGKQKGHIMEFKEKEGEPEVARYDLFGTKWKQEQNTYEEDCKCNEITEAMQSEIKITSIVFGIDLFLSNPLLPDLFAIIFKPDTPTLWSKIKQRYYAWKNNVNLKKPILKTQQWQRRKILQDFFVLNVSSMIGSTSSEFISNLISMNLKNPMGIKSDGKSPSITQQTETTLSKK